MDDELAALLEAIYQRYHYDFRSYRRASLRRGVERARSSLGIATLGGMTDRVLQDSTAFFELLRHMTISVSDFFRDPGYYLALRQRVVPHLATYPSLRIWVAGCGTGEEAYSIAIVLHEEGLLERTLLYATDIDATSLSIARTGVYEAARVRRGSASYAGAGGRGSLSDYYTSKGSRVVFSRALKEHILFSDHSLSTDAPFAEMQLVSCRNVLIYFDKELQDRAIGLFRESLCPRGFLGVGAEETLAFSTHAAAFEPFAPDERIFRLRRERA